MTMSIKSIQAGDSLAGCRSKQYARELGEVSQLMPLEDILLKSAADDEQRQARQRTFVLLRHLYNIPEPEPVSPFQTLERQRLHDHSILRGSQEYTTRCDRCGSKSGRSGEYEVYNEAVDTEMSHGHFHHTCYDTYSFTYCTRCGYNDLCGRDENNLPPLQSGYATVEGFLNIMSTSNAVYQMGRDLVALVVDGKNGHFSDVLYVTDGRKSCSACGCPDLLTASIAKDPSLKFQVCLRDGHIEADYVEANHVETPPPGLTGENRFWHHVIWDREDE